MSNASSTIEHRQPRSWISKRAAQVQQIRGERVEAEQTLPRDAKGEPAVDPDLWLVHVHYAQTHEPPVRAELVDEYRAYATSIAWRMHRDGEPLEDLIQISMEALLVALQRFEPKRTIPFTGFATPTIVGSLKRHYRDNGWSIRVPRRVHELAAPARRQADRLTALLGRQPVAEEVASALGVSTDRVAETNAATYARSVMSLDVTTSDSGRLAETPGLEDQGLAKAENLIALQQALDQLSDHERAVLHEYFVEEQTQSEIADRFGVSQMQVSRWITAAIRRLRSRMLAE